MGWYVAINSEFLTSYSILTNYKFIITYSYYNSLISIKDIYRNIIFTFKKCYNIIYNGYLIFKYTKFNYFILITYPKLCFKFRLAYILYISTQITIFALFSIIILLSKNTNILELANYYLHNFTLNYELLLFLNENFLLDSSLFNDSYYSNSEFYTLHFSSQEDNQEINNNMNPGQGSNLPDNNNNNPINNDLFVANNMDVDNNSSDDEDNKSDSSGKTETMADHGYTSAADVLSNIPPALSSSMPILSPEDTTG